MKTYKIIETTNKLNRPSNQKLTTFPKTSTLVEEPAYSFPKEQFITTPQTNNDSVSDADEHTIELMVTQTANRSIINETFRIVSTDTKTTTVDPKDVEELK